MKPRLLFPVLLLGSALPLPAAEDARPFGPDYPNLDSLATGEWWAKRSEAPKKKQGQPPPPSLDVARDQGPAPAAACR